MGEALQHSFKRPFYAGFHLVEATDQLKSSPCRPLCVYNPLGRFCCTVQYFLEIFPSPAHSITHTAS
jgi:hypothetical protein